MSPALRNNEMIQKVADLIRSGDVDDQEAEEALEAVYYQEILPIAEDRLEQFRNIVKKSLSASKIRKNLSRNPDVLSQIKALKGLKSKAISRGKPLTKIGDIVRGAILFETNEEVDMYIENFRRKFSRNIAEYEFKAEGSDPKFGYFGSHHIDMMVDGLVVELQVMTKRLWTYKEKAHDIYVKMRDAKAQARLAADYEDLPNSLKRQLGFEPAYGDEEEEMAHSKRIFQIGNKPKRFREEAEVTPTDNIISEDFTPAVLWEMVKRISKTDPDVHSEWVTESIGSR